MDQLQKMIFDVLGHSEVNLINFQVEGASIFCMKYWMVRAALNDGKITAIKPPNFNTDTASYKVDTNTFKVGFTSTGNNVDREALLVHEATHAAMDLTGNKHRVRVSEGVAYIAQCLYFYHRNRAQLAGGATPTFGDPVLAAAWELSKRVRTPAALSWNDMKPLYKALDNHRHYKGKIDETVNFNG